MDNKTYSWLALGDSYTIGEGVSLYDNYPYQCLQFLREESIALAAPEIIAKTGWTTGELIAQMTKQQLFSRYDVVTLLIGVNNQYRKLSRTDYEADLRWLIDKALLLVNDNRQKLILLNIPDWGITPTGAGLDRSLIAAEIDAFNHLKQNVALEYGLTCIDINTDYRTKGSADDMMVADKLHPAAAIYTDWAVQLKPVMKRALGL